MSKNARAALAAAVTVSGQVGYTLDVLQLAGTYLEWLDSQVPEPPPFERCVYALDDGSRPLKQCRQRKDHDGRCVTEDGTYFHAAPFFGRY